MACPGEAPGRHLADHAPLGSVGWPTPPGSPPGSARQCIPPCWVGRGRGSSSLGPFVRSESSPSSAARDLLQGAPGPEAKPGTAATRPRVEIHVAPFYLLLFIAIERVPRRPSWRPARGGAGARGVGAPRVGRAMGRTCGLTECVRGGFGAESGRVQDGLSAPPSQLTVAGYPLAASEDPEPDGQVGESAASWTGPGFGEHAWPRPE